MKKIKVGIISGMDIMMTRQGKANKGDSLVFRGCGVHTPKKYKEKTRQQSKNEMRRYY